MNDDNVYRERAALVAHLASVYPSVLAYNDPQEPDWPLVYIDTPQGQLSWHLAPTDLDLFGHVPVVEPDQVIWDGHDTTEKYRRLAALASEQAEENGSLDPIAPSVPRKSTEFWKAYSRKWESRCKQAEAEKTELIAQLNDLRDRLAQGREHKRERRDAILNGDVYA